MTCPVFYIGNQVFGGAGRPFQLAVHDFAEQMNEVDVLPFIMPADIVGFSNSSFVVNEVDRVCMIFNIQPVADIFTLAVNRDQPVVFYIVYRQRDQLFRKLERSVIVGTVGNHRWQPVGMVICPYEMIGTGLGSRVGTPRIIRRIFIKVSCSSQGTIYFVGGNMIKPFICKVLPDNTGRIQEVHRADNIGMNELHRAADRPVNMRFGSKMYHAVETVLLKHRLHQFPGGDVGFDKFIIWFLFNIPQVRKVASIRKIVKVHNFVVGILFYKPAYDMGTNKTGAPGD